MQRVIDIPSPGGPEALVLAQRPIPQPGLREVLVEVHAAGVNRADVKQRQGTYPMPPGAPSIPGLEIAGVVRSCGEGVRRWRPGDRVCGLVVGAGYAEYCTVPEEQCLPVPRGLGFIEAAALPEALFTVWISVFEAASLAPGETLLVHGGASGIGTMAIQMATVMGSVVFATAGTAERCTACEKYGAVRGINYKTEAWEAIVRECSGGRGVDVILDMVGAPYLAKNLSLLAWGGRLSYIAADGGRKLEFDVRDLMMKRLSITGANLRHRSVAEKGRIAEVLEARVWPLIELARIRPIVGAIVPMERVVDAHQLLEQGKVPGKVVLQVRPE